ncbi:hypothetical protein BC834DRAFT_842053 [Gloeopeniophorella convolvens]|nr:hypothetical protein BC834DRAFT_842053 [Gloeopeniophorella convolvens]
MTQKDQKPHGETPRPKVPQDQEDDYDIYLFWPSFSNRDLPSESPSPLYGPVSPSSDSLDLYPGLDSGPPSPLTFAPASDFRFPPPVDERFELNAPPPSEPPAQAQNQNALPKYSNMFKMGLFFSVGRFI